MLSVSVAGLDAASKTIDVASNNLANASTVGFQRSVAYFGDIFSSDPAANPKTAVGSGVVTQAVMRDTTAGSLQTTGVVTNMAIDGRGFFEVKDPSASVSDVSYTRAGAFNLDKDGYIVSAGGQQLVGYGPDQTTIQALQVPPQISPGLPLPDSTLTNVDLAGIQHETITIAGSASATGSMTVTDMSSGSPVTYSIPVRGPNAAGTGADSAATIASNIATALAADSNLTATANADGTVNVVYKNPGNYPALQFSTASVTAAQTPTSTFTAYSATSSSFTAPITTPLATGDTINLSIPLSPADSTAAGTSSLTVPVTLASGQSVADQINAAIQAAAKTAAPSATFSDLPEVTDGDVDSGGALTSLNVTYPTSFTLASGLTISASRTGVFGTVAASSTAGNPAVQEFSFNAAGADQTIQVAGQTVNVSASDTAQQIANKVATALQLANPSSTVVVDGNAVQMTYSLADSASAKAIFPSVKNKAPIVASSGITVAGSSDAVLLQGISISPKGEVSATYSNGATYSMGFIGLATFPSDSGLKDIGGGMFAQTGSSGAPTFTPAGAPNAGNIMSGQLEQSNVDITTELMSVIQAQQVYNGNARAIQTMMDAVNKITDLR
jgi:flagellar hook protein FlgE